jgi:hypothetical protein
VHSHPRISRPKPWLNTPVPFCLVPKHHMTGRSVCKSILLLSLGKCKSLRYTLALERHLTDTTSTGDQYRDQLMHSCHLWCRIVMSQEAQYMSKKMDWYIVQSILLRNLADSISPKGTIIKRCSKRLDTDKSRHERISPKHARPVGTAIK